MTTSANTGCDAAVAHAAKSAGAVKHPALVLATCILASSLAFVDGSVVNVGLPAIGRSLHGGAEDLQWVINAYLLPLSALLLLGGALGDRFGRRTLLIVGVGLFALASAACGFAPSLAWLLVGRTLQGVGAAMLLPNSLAILGGAFEGEARGKAVGSWAAASAMSAALGPVLGGWLIDTVGWPAIFFINLPLAAAAIALALAVVRELSKPGQSAALDWAGATLATLALGGLVWGLTLGTGPHGWSAQAWIAVIVGVGLTAAFVAVELKLGDRAMTPPALFGSRPFIGINLLTLLLYGALGGFMVLLPFVLIDSAGYRATAAGAALIPFPLVMAAMGPVTGAVAGRFGSRGLLTAGSVVVALGFLTALRIDQHGGYWTEVLPCVLLVAFGMSMAAAPLTTAVLASVDEQHTGMASGFNSAVSRTGGLVATALLGTVLAQHGAALLGPFHLAAVAGAAAAALGGVCSFVFLAGARKG